MNSSPPDSHGSKSPASVAIIPIVTLHRLAHRAAPSPLVVSTRTASLPPSVASTRTASRPPSSAPPSRSVSPESYASRARNEQVSLDHQKLEALFQKFTTSQSTHCPVGCGFKQSSRRLGDMKRHIKTHSADARNMWVCRGVPVAQAKLFGIKAVKHIYTIDGMEMTGGCQKSFARRDSLDRHVRNKKIPCVGEVLLEDEEEPRKKKKNK